MNIVEREKHTAETMIRLYCRHKHGHSELCDGCMELLTYAHARLSACRYGDKKGTCKRCEKHCYNANMRDRIQRVMRFSGPRMVLYAPLATLRHLLHR